MKRFLIEVRDVPETRYRMRDDSIAKAIEDRTRSIIANATEGPIPMVAIVPLEVESLAKEGA